MVTVITNKLKKQSLEDLPNEPLRVSSNTDERREYLLQGDTSDRGLRYRLSNERRSGLGHLRTRSYPTHNLRGSNCRGTPLDSSTMHAAATPPANKKLCRSISVPEEEPSEEGSFRSWVPKASVVWHPVKGLSRTPSRPRSESSPTEKLHTTSARNASAETDLSLGAGVNSISTPPASPTPRPASAFAALSDNLLCIKASQGVEDGSTPFKKVHNTTDVCPRLQRSRSQPSFERARTCGIKRRIEDDFDVGSNLRPALDLAKMEESSYYRFRDKKRGLRIPKCSNKRDPKGLAAPYFTEHESFILKPIVSSPLDVKVSSVMITPTSSPTKQLDLAVKLTTAEPLTKKILIDREKGLDRKITDEGVFHLDYDSELDIASIEGDDFY